MLTEVFVSPEALKARMDAGAAVVLEVGWGPPKPGPRIPHSVYLDTDAIEDGRPTWRLLPVPQIAAEVGRHGISESDPIVVTSHSAIAAARVVFALILAGAKDVAMLDCGLAIWQQDWPTSADYSHRPPAVFHASPRPQIRAGLDELAEISAANSGWIADVRSEAEFRGEVSGYSYLEAKGRIPNSLHAGDADDAAGLYVLSDGRLRPPSEIAALWSSFGLNIQNGQFEKDTIFVCGGGWRAALAWLYAQSLRLPNARVCPEGWSGWSTIYGQDQPGRPTQKPTLRPYISGP